MISLKLIEIWVVLIALVFLAVLAYRNLRIASRQINESARMSFSPRQIPVTKLIAQIEAAGSKDDLLRILAENPAETLTPKQAGLFVFQMDQLQLAVEDRYQLASVVPAMCELGRHLAPDLRYGQR